MSHVFIAEKEGISVNIFNNLFPFTYSTVQYSTVYITQLAFLGLPDWFKVCIRVMKQNHPILPLGLLDTDSTSQRVDLLDSQPGSSLERLVLPDSLPESSLERLSLPDSLPESSLERLSLPDSLPESSLERLGLPT
jgi:hypothetical protein